MRRLLFAIPVVLFVAVAGYFAHALLSGYDSSRVPSALIGKPVPRFELPPLRQTPEAAGLASADLEGGVALVNVFASWCVPCKVEHPLLMRLKADGVVPIYGINWKDEREDALAWLDELGDPFSRIGHDPSGRVGIEWGVYGVPETYVVDRTGRIRYKHVGPILPKDLEETILPLIRELSG